MRSFQLGKKACQRGKLIGTQVVEDRGSFIRLLTQERDQNLRREVIGAKGFLPGSVHMDQVELLVRDRLANDLQEGGPAHSGSALHNQKLTLA